MTSLVEGGSVRVLSVVKAWHSSGKALSGILIL